jgi:xanthine dehydrogenase accessory factor
VDYSFPKLLETLAAGPERGLALATIIETEGSTPQVAGASAVFSETGLVFGTVGGGLLEARAEAMAIEALRDGKARLVSIRLDADPSDMEGAICGGAAKVLVDPGVGRDRDAYKKALEGFHKRRPGYLITEIKRAADDFVEVGRRWLLADEAANKDRGLDVLAAVAIDDFGTDLRHRPGFEWNEGRGVFIELVEPLPRLIIAGAGHVGRAVARLGSLLDFSVTVIDDRAEFANKGNVPEADEIVAGEIGESVAKIAEYSGFGDRYFVIVTRGHQKDAEALRAVIGKPAAYIGMIGSKTKVETMRREFLKAGWATDKEWAGIHTPIGLDIGSKTVEEIAVSIAAELVLVRSRRKAGGLA